MFSSKIKRPLGRAAFVLLTLMLLCSCGQKVSEEQARKTADQILSFIGAFYTASAGEIQVDTGKNAITYKNVTLTPAMDFTGQGPAIQMEIGSINLSGIDDDTYAGKPGELSSVKQLSFVNTVILMDSEPVGTIAAMNYADYTFSLRDALAILDKNPGQPLDKEQFKALFPIMAKGSIKALSMDNFNFDIGIAGMNVERFEGKDASATSLGASSLKNISVSFMGAKVLGIGGISVDKAVMPDFYTMMLNNPALLEPGQEALDLDNPLELLSKMQLDNLRFTNVNSNLPEAKFTLEEAVGNFKVSDDQQIKMDVNASKLVIDHKLWSSHPALRNFGREYNEDLVLNGKYSAEGKRTSEEGVMAWIFDIAVADSKLGGATAEIKAKGDKEDMFLGNSKNLMLEKVYVNLDNKGWMDILTFFASNSSDARARAEAAVVTLQMQGANAPENQKDLADNLGRAILDGGSVQIRLEPDEAISVRKLGRSFPEELTSNYTPPATKLNRR